MWCRAQPPLPPRWGWPSAVGVAEDSSPLPEADLYLLKHILHDCDDGQAVRILENCRRAVRPGGRVIVIELLLGEISESGFAPLSDLNMMVMLTGRGARCPNTAHCWSRRASASTRAARFARQWR